MNGSSINGPDFAQRLVMMWARTRARNLRLDAGRAAVAYTKGPLLDCCTRYALALEHAAQELDELADQLEREASEIVKAHDYTKGAARADAGAV